jgi:RsiW-degrading membrane proteinase PrsW (M82 family)
MRALWLRWRSDPLRWTLWLIAAGTFLSGLLLIVLQKFVLDLLSAPTTTSDRLFFAIIGMFMAIVGGTLAQDLLGQPHRFIVGWSALQKACASAAMSVAVALSVFSYYGIILAAFDFCSALLAIAFWWRLSS